MLVDLAIQLKKLRANPYADYDLSASASYRDIQISGAKHIYQLVVNVKNTGSHKLDEFQLRLFCPRAFVFGKQAIEDDRLSTETHQCFIVDQTRQPTGSYPGDSLRDPMIVDYFVDHRLHHDGVIMQSDIRLELRYPNATGPKTYTYSMQEFNEF